MSKSPQELASREHAIEAAQRRLRWLEIETRRMKAELARLSADCDDEVAEALSREWGRPESNADVSLELAGVGATGRSEESPVRSFGVSTSGQPRFATAVDFTASSSWPSELLAEAESFESDEFESEWTDATLPETETVIAQDTNVSIPGPSPSLSRRAKITPLACSFTLHTAIVVFLAFGVSYTVAKLEEHSLTLTTSLPKTEAAASLPAPLGDEELAPTSFTDGAAAGALTPDESFALSGDIAPAMDFAESGAPPIPLAPAGGLDRLPSDLGTLPIGTADNAGGNQGAGAASSGGQGGDGRAGNSGKLGGGSPNGDRNATMFFGTHAKGNRFVFVIDNSSSMKNGRLDMARVELLRTVQNLSPKQSFYVIFVSDQTYPMFFPQREPNMVAATPANVKRLADWLPKAILASGKNRELIKAMDMAAALEPDAVYLLWDGDMKYSEAVRLDVMSHLTAPNQWAFTVYTLGMGATSLDAEQNLAAIAQAHGGVYRRVDIPGVKSRK